jgi:hypothetical protein
MKTIRPEAAAAAISRRSAACILVGGSTAAILAASVYAAGDDKKVQSTGARAASDQDEIQDLVYRYCMAIDNRDATAYAACWAPGLCSPDDAEKVIQMHRSFEYTVHNILNHTHTVQGDRASGTAYSTVTFVRNRGGKLMKFDAYSRYLDEELVRQDGKWYFRKREWKPLFSTEEVPVMDSLPPGFVESLK